MIVLTKAYVLSRFAGYAVWAGLIAASIAIAEVSDAVWLGLVGVLTIIVKEYFDRQRAKDAADAAKEVAAKAEQDRKMAEAERKAVAAKAEEVKKSLEEHTAAVDSKLESIADVGEAAKKVGEAVHTLVNSNMSNQLKVSAVALRRVADLTQDVTDGKAASLAEFAYDDHQAKQQIVDDGNKIADAPKPGGPVKVELASVSPKVAAQLTEAAKPKGE